MDTDGGLSRFVDAQRGTYAQALQELRDGRKRSHWMWFVFPQLHGLGTSAMSRRYALGGREEACRYVAHPLLGARLRECCDTVLASDRSADAMFGSPDDTKLQSSMTLFAVAAPFEPAFAQVLVAKFGGQQDFRTLEMLRSG